jgi:triosephosphate isomerase (TIM)
MSKNIFVGFNWKMNPVSIQAAAELFQVYSNLKGNSKFDFAVFAPDIYISRMTGQGVDFGSQSVSIQNPTGAFTAETSAKMYKELGAKYALIGHSESRTNLNLSSENLNSKVKIALTESLIPVLCTAYHDQTKGEQQLSQDLDKTLLGVDGSKEIIVAFEPLDSIGGSAMTPENVDKYLGFLKDYLSKKGFSNAKVLYGGGVNSANLESMLNCQNLDGVLVGGSSLKPDEINKFFEIANRLAL